LTVESLYRQLYGPTEVAKQRVVENFSGDTLDERWSISHDKGGSGAMDDAIDGGFKQTSGGANDNTADLKFNDIKQYSNTDSEWIWVVKHPIVSSNLIFLHGLGSIINADGYTARYRQSEHNNWQLSTTKTTATNTDTGIVSTTNIVKFHGKIKSASATLFIDGILGATNTTTMPDKKLQPWSWYRNDAASVVRDINYLYFEAWNT